MSKSILVVVIALASLCAPLCAQQPNTAGGTLLVNSVNHATGGMGPISVSLAPLGSFVLDIQGPGLSPILLAAGTINGGGGTSFPFGLLDLNFPGGGFSLVADGVNPVTPFDFFANTSGAGAWQFAASIAGNASSGFALQAAVIDPSIAAGATLTAATDVTVAPLTTNVLTIPEAQLGDDVVLTYFHQALSFPFYGQNYGQTNIDTNGYVTFGNPIASEWQTAINPFLQGPARIAPFWTDGHMSSTVASAFGIMSSAPASIVVTESIGVSGPSILIEWRNFSEAAAANTYDFACRLGAGGDIAFLYGTDLVAGQVPAQGTTISLVGISPGGNLSANIASQDLIVGPTGVVAFGPSAANDAIFEYFGVVPFPMGDFLIPGNASQSMTFTPATGPLDTSYTLMQL